MNLLDELLHKRPTRTSPRGRIVYSGEEDDYTTQKYNPANPMKAEWEKWRARVREYHDAGLGPQAIVGMTGYSRTFVNDTLRALRNPSAAKPWEKK